MKDLVCKAWVYAAFGLIYSVIGGGAVHMGDPVLGFVAGSIMLFCIILTAITVNEINCDLVAKADFERDDKGKP